MTWKNVGAVGQAWVAHQAGIAAGLIAIAPITARLKATPPARATTAAMPWAFSVRSALRRACVIMGVA